MHHGNTTEFFAVPHKYHGNCSVQVLWDYNLISPCHHYSHSAYIIMHMLLRVFHSTLYSIQSVYCPLPECLRQIFRDPLSRNSRQEFHRLVQTWGWGKVIVVCCTQTCPLELHVCPSLCEGMLKSVVSAGCCITLVGKDMEVLFSVKITFFFFSKFARGRDFSHCLKASFFFWHPLSTLQQRAFFIYFSFLPPHGSRIYDQSNE